MSSNVGDIKIANAIWQEKSKEVSGEYINLDDEQFYRIQNYDALEPFFISLVSSSNHWLFISTTGGLTAGRVDADQALFPYYTVDKITENLENTGSKTLLLVTKGNTTHLWEPFSDYYQGLYRVERNLYKNVAGTALVFEEINADLQLTFRYAWRTGERFGFVKTNWLTNTSGGTVHVRLLDGIQNVLPANVNAEVQNQFSVLLNAYKRSEVDVNTSLGIYSLSSRLTDIAEPSESLRANVVWQVGLDAAGYLLSSDQLGRFREGQPVIPQQDVRSKRGAYFVQANVELDNNQSQQWHIVCDVFMDTSQIVNLNHVLGATDASDLSQQIAQDIQTNTDKLVEIVAASDGLQMTASATSINHHFANVLFNVMRGGIFANQYTLVVDDLRDFVGTRNKLAVEANRAFFESLPDTISVQDLKGRLAGQSDDNLVRLCYSYLPLTFSRRHGDPSRPWNRFAIHLKNPDGSQQLNYEGNWRDIFQNWEALAYSYPEFIEGMIFTFLNATTYDGYNPYRITRDGVDWEAPEPENPWANIGYWSDHQIIYLQKLLEVCQRFYPEKLGTLLTRAIFTYTNVPYNIKPYAELTQDPYQSIDFDWQKHALTHNRVAEIGTDGQLVFYPHGQLVYANLLEKLLSLMLAKLVNFVPEGGLWMNTQRPEWNDANNALAGWGLSVVTIGYLRRYTNFMINLLSMGATDSIPITQGISQLLDAIHSVFKEHESLLSGQITDQNRRLIIDQLGQAGSDFRQRYYELGVVGECESVDRQTILAFLNLTQRYLEHTLRANKRDDDLYHAYNILSLKGNAAGVSYLNEMLEGQVSILSSGLLTSAESIDLLQSLRSSALYRDDQHTYILYPNRELDGFLQKNTIATEDVATLKLVQVLVGDHDLRLIVKDTNGGYHFSGDIRNAKDVVTILSEIAEEPNYAKLVQDERDQILDIFERVFNHAAFTGRSGSFFAYEGLGSIYWHMISKLLLATQEVVLNASKLPNVNSAELDKLIAAYYDIQKGLGYHKPPQIYGAFPTDPYSHTPENKGAKQPGMTGMVKEEIMTRFSELGLFVEGGTLSFDAVLVTPSELLNVSSVLQYVDVMGRQRRIALPEKSLAFTFCQVPIILKAAETNSVMVTFTDQGTLTSDDLRLDAALSNELFSRSNIIDHITVSMQI